MKKTLITLAALSMASVAMANAANGLADTTLTGNKLADGSIGDLDGAFTMSVVVDWNKAVNGLGDWASTSSLKLGAQGSAQWWNMGMTLFQSDERTTLSAGIRIDGDDLRALTVAADNDANDGVTVIGGTLSGNSYDMIFDTSYNVRGKLSLVYTFIPDADPDTDGNQTRIVLYALKNDGTLAATQISFDNEWAFNYPYDYITMGNKHDSMEGIRFYEGELTQAQIKYVAQTSIPEPATATLSLLALAGLAARRRRK